MAWFTRFGIVAALALLGWFGWAGREAYIAETPAGVSVIVRAESPEPAADAALPVPEAEGALATQDPAPASSVPPVVRPAPAQTPPPAPRPTPAPASPPPPVQVEQQGTSDAPRVVRLTVPFVSQAPYRIWLPPYKEFCEEASVYTMHLFLQGMPVGSASDLDAALQDIQRWEIEHIGYWEDTTAAETVRILREKFGYTNARVIPDVTQAMIKERIAAGRPVIVPLRGQEVDSPYYTPPGPLYHMLVIIGYDDATGEWITNDVGTNTKGAGQRYAYDDLYDALADWSHEDGAPIGGKMMIVVE
ncbi:MAG: C39 family peptidase [bacterium]|nr:C39 family peptidase [bacterium]